MNQLLPPIDEEPPLLKMARATGMQVTRSSRDHRVNFHAPLGLLIFTCDLYNRGQDIGLRYGGWFQYPAGFGFTRDSMTLAVTTPEERLIRMWLRLRERVLQSGLPDRYTALVIELYSQSRYGSYKSDLTLDECLEIVTLFPKPKELTALCVTRHVSMPYIRKIADGSLNTGLVLDMFPLVKH